MTLLMYPFACILNPVIVRRDCRRHEAERLLKGDMPLYEYECRECGKRFEAFVTGSRRPVCPSCHGENLEKLLSVFGVGGAATGPAGKSPAGGSCSSGGG